MRAKGAGKGVALADPYRVWKNSGMMQNSNVSLARLRAAASLLPNIISDLDNKKLSKEKAALMGEFCSWAKRCAIPGDNESEGLVDQITAGLIRLDRSLSA